MLSRFGIGALGVLVCFQPGVARAEAGLAAPCLGVDVIEVFAGAVGCRDARYLVVEIWGDGFEARDLDLYDTDGNGQPLNLSARPATNTERTTLLIGTPSVADVFGVQPDIVTQRLALAPEGGTISSCNAYYEYGREVGSDADLCEGDALRSDGSGWTRVEPQPQNSLAERGTFRGCGAAALPAAPGVDASVIVDASAPELLDASVEQLCLPLEPDVTPLPTSTVPSSPTPGATPGADDVPPNAVEDDIVAAPPSSTLTDVADGSAHSPSGITAPSDAPSDGGRGNDVRAVATDVDGGGCDCHVGGARGPHGSGPRSLLSGLLVALGWVRRNQRVRWSR